MKILVMYPDGVRPSHAQRATDLSTWYARWVKYGVEAYGPDSNAEYAEYPNAEGVDFEPLEEGDNYIVYWTAGDEDTFGFIISFDVSDEAKTLDGGWLNRHCKLVDCITLAEAALGQCGKPIHFDVNNVLTFFYGYIGIPNGFTTLMHHMLPESDYARNLN